MKMASIGLKPLLLLLLPTLLYALPTYSLDTTKTTKVAQDILTLPGELNDVPVFNSNSPEVVKTEGILLSTFPSTESDHPEAHLNYALNGRFDVFFHHINNCSQEDHTRTLFLAFVVGNASKIDKVKIKTLQASSYLSQPDAPFIQLDSILNNKDRKYFAGPGDRVMLDMLCHHQQGGWTQQCVLAPGEAKVFFVLPVPVNNLEPPINGRSGLLKLESDGPVYAALLAQFSEKENKLDKNTWLDQLKTGSLCELRDIVPSKPGVLPYKFGRVAGVSKGDVWQGEISTSLVKAGGQSYPLSSVHGGTFGTEQIQSAPMLVRYPDSAYEAHGNYGVKYDLTLNLSNDSESVRPVGIIIQTPLKQNNPVNELQFYDPPASQIFFRGSVKLSYIDDCGNNKEELIHLVEHRGEQMPPLLKLQIAAHDKRQVNLTFFYPPDSTPPQILTLEY